MVGRGGRQGEGASVLGGSRALWPTGNSLSQVPVLGTPHRSARACSSEDQVGTRPGPANLGCGWELGSQTPFLQTPGRVGGSLPGSLTGRERQGHQRDSDTGTRRSVCLPAALPVAASLRRPGTRFPPCCRATSARLLLSSPRRWEDRLVRGSTADLASSLNLKGR